MSDQTAEVSRDPLLKDDLVDVVEKVQSFAEENGGTNVARLRANVAELSALGGRRGEIPEVDQPKPTDGEIANWAWGWPF
jgi:hypothetical protein